MHRGSRGTEGWRTNVSILSEFFRSCILIVFCFFFWNALFRGTVNLPGSADKEFVSLILDGHADAHTHTDALRNAFFMQSASEGRVSTVRLLKTACTSRRHDRLATRLYANVQRTSGPTHTAQPTHLVMHLRWKVSGPVHCLGNGRLCRWGWRLWWSNDVITEPESAQDRPPLTGPTVRILQHSHGLVGLSSEIGMGQVFDVRTNSSSFTPPKWVILKCLVQKVVFNFFH